MKKTIGKYRDKISLPAAIRYLCRAFSELEGWSISFDHSSKDRKFHPDIVSGLYRIIYDLFQYLTSIGTNGQIQVQLIEKSNGLLFLVALKQENQKTRPKTDGLRSVINQIKSLQGEIVINLAPGDELDITIDIPDHHIPSDIIDQPTRVLIADDHPLMRDCLSMMLKSVENVIVVGVACNGKEAIDKIKSNPVDLVLMDISMPELNGIEATKYITNKFPQVKVLAITMHLEDHFVSQMIEAGALGYVSKASSKTTLMEAIRSVLQGEPVTH